MHVYNFRDFYLFMFFSIVRVNFGINLIQRWTLAIMRINIFKDRRHGFVIFKYLRDNL